MSQSLNQNLKSINIFTSSDKQIIVNHHKNTSGEEGTLEYLMDMYLGDKHGDENSDDNHNNNILLELGFCSFKSLFCCLELFNL